MWARASCSCSSGTTVERRQRFSTSTSKAGEGARPTRPVWARASCSCSSGTTVERCQRFSTSTSKAAGEGARPHGLYECERLVPASAILEDFRDLLYQRFSREGFGQIRPLASLKALAGHGIFRVARDEDGSKAAAKQRELGSQVAAVAVGQYHIGEQQMDSFALAVQGAKSFRGSLAFSTR